MELSRQRGRLRQRRAHNGCLILVNLCCLQYPRHHEHYHHLYHRRRQRWDVVTAGAAPGASFTGVSSSMGAPFRHHHHWSGVHGEVAGVPLSLGCLHVKRLITEFDLLAFWPTDTTDLGGPFVHISAPKCNYRIATSYLFRAHRRGHVSWCVSQDAFGSL